MATSTYDRLFEAADISRLDRKTLSRWLDQGLAAEGLAEPDVVGIAVDGMGKDRRLRVVHRQVVLELTETGRFGKKRVEARRVADLAGVHGLRPTLDLLGARQLTVAGVDQHERPVFELVWDLDKRYAGTKLNPVHEAKQRAWFVHFLECLTDALEGAGRRTPA